MAEEFAVAQMLCGVANKLNLAALRKHVMPCVFAAFVVGFVVDATYNKLGSSNGKLISLTDTCSSICSYRAGLAALNMDHQHLRIGRIPRIIVAVLIIKFLAGTVASLMLGTTPLWLSGNRHVWSTLFGVFLLYSCDALYKSMLQSSAVRLLVGMGTGLYKVRKAVFAVEAVARACNRVEECSFAFAFLVTILQVDGNTIVRKVVLWMEARLEGGTSPKKTEGAQSLLRDGYRGMQQLLFDTFIPLAVVSGFLWFAACTEWPNGATSDSSLMLRVCLLGFFMWRQGSFHELASIHDASWPSEADKQTVTTKIQKTEEPVKSKKKE
jgi:hypothetical protein